MDFNSLSATEAIVFKDKVTSCQASIALSFAPDTDLSLAVGDSAVNNLSGLWSFEKISELTLININVRILPFLFFFLFFCFFFGSNGCSLLHSVCKDVCHSRITSQGKTTSLRAFV